MIRIGIDTGGTFTDFVFSDGKEIWPLKLPSTPANPADAIMEGLKNYMDRQFELIHGTTVSTNAFLQKKLAKTAFIGTKGFEHLLYIGRQNRTNLFCLKARKPSPIIPLSLCYGLPERTMKDGAIRREPDLDNLGEIIHSLKDQQVDAVGITFLHSYRNPENEKIVARILRDEGFYVTASHEIMPEYREYERAVVTVLNAGLQPVIAEYVNNLETRLDGGTNKKLWIIQSNGGILPPDLIKREPIRTITSGPAGGVTAALEVARLTGDTHMVTLDMGGTSTDVSSIQDSHLTMTRDFWLENLPLRLPMIDISTVGAGGGSIAHIDRGGGLQVGPQSAGADPGPACYGNADDVTVTDAFVVAGIILPEMFLGGKKRILPKRSVKAMQALADKLGKSIYETAEGVIRITVSSMERAMRTVTLEKGEDPRFYTLMPFGGAGGLVATQLADRLGIKRILIPPKQGVFSALGMLSANFKKELVYSFIQPYTPGIEKDIDPILERLTNEAAEIVATEGFEKEKTSTIMMLDMRYHGQSYELTVPYFPGKETEFVKKFHDLHHKYYSYSLPDDRCEIINIRVLAVGRCDEPVLKKNPPQVEDAVIHQRKKAYYNGDLQEFLVYRRSELMPGNRLSLPAIIVSDDATVVVPKRYTAIVDNYHNIILQAVESRRRRFA